MPHRDIGKAFRVDRFHHATIGNGAGKDAEFTVLQLFGEIDHLHPDASLGLVGAITIHGVVPGQSLERSGDFDTASLLEHRGKHAFDQSDDVVLVYEGSLDIDLGKLGLTIGTEILVTEATGDLEILFNSSNH